MPRVSADADSVSAMRITRSAMGTVRISRYSGRARSFSRSVVNAPRVATDWRRSVMSPRSTGKNRKITATIMMKRSGRCSSRSAASVRPASSRPIISSIEIHTAAMRGKSTSKNEIVVCGNSASAAKSAARSPTPARAGATPPSVMDKTTSAPKTQNARRLFAAETAAIVARKKASFVIGWNRARLRVSGGDSVGRKLSIARRTADRSLSLFNGSSESSVFEALFENAMQRSQTAAISSRSCVITRTVFVSAILRISAAHDSRLSASCPAVGSSSTTIGFSDKNAVISVSFCIWPPESENGCRSRHAHMPMRCKRDSACAVNSGVSAWPYCSS